MVLEQHGYVEGGYYSTHGGPAHYPVVPPHNPHAGGGYYEAHHQSSHGGHGYPVHHQGYSHGATHHGVVYATHGGCPFTSRRSGCYVRKGC
ncbi:hypothetical protein DCAR_0520311 [Daucus carota subsp. sativus]|uniref:Uncharacterized protein n=1 Tax=Daucus carota subsp. sativus TaxID=79200 RepID=A0A162A342_DAUCS|nr:hypothetical protein DCAR_0520311 [Daucus carota subsp. sativus]